MMSEKNLIHLGIVAAVLVIVVALFYSGLDFSGDNFRSGRNLIQGLETSNIAAIEIKAKDGTVTLQSGENGFTLAEKAGYPVPTEKINDFLIKLLDIRLQDKITDSAANHAELGVAADSDEAVSVTLKDAEDKAIIGIVRGKTLARGGGYYVRIEGEDTVYSTQSAVSISSKPADYLDTELFSLTPEDIVGVEVRTGDDSYTITRDGEQIKLSSVPSGREADEDEFETALEALSNIEFEDVFPAGELELQWNSIHRCTLKSGLTYVVQLAEKDGSHYARLAAEPPQVGDITIAPDEEDESLKEKEAILLALEGADEFNTRHARWVYQLDSYDAEDLAMPLEDLLVPLDDEDNSDEG